MGYEVCPRCGCDGARPAVPLPKVTWQLLNERCRRCGLHPAEYERDIAPEVFLLELRKRDTFLAYLEKHKVEHFVVPEDGLHPGAVRFTYNDEVWEALYLPNGYFKTLVWA